MTRRACRATSLAVIVVVSLPSCTTFVQPTSCKDKAASCGGIRDARFCDIVAVDVEGADCEVLGLLRSHHFCVVTGSACVHADYAVKGRDCRVHRYQAVRSTWYADCPPGAPVFVSR